MADHFFDLVVVGGGIHGAAVARDAVGRGLKVMLAEKGDYACATSSASSKLIHGGLRYLERLEFGLVRESLVERAQLLNAAPHLVTPLRFLLPIYGWQRRQALTLRAALALYDALSFGDGLPASGRLDDDAIAQLPRLRQEALVSVFHYCDCMADDARLTLAVLLDARARGADIRNRRAVTAIAALENGYAVELDERGWKRQVAARFVVNAAGPFVAEIEAMTDKAPPRRPLTLVRGSHIVLPMPEPAQADAYALQDEDERIVFALPWLDRKFLILGTTDVPHESSPGEPVCSAEETAYLLAAYNRYFANPAGPAAATDIVHSWSGVRALHDEEGARPSRISRSPALAAIANGSGGFVTLYGGKLTTHRALAEQVVETLRRLGAPAGAAWTKDVPLHGGGLALPELLDLAALGPNEISEATRRRWALTYGDQIQSLFVRIAAAPRAAREIVPGIPSAELEHAVEIEDAMTAEDFLLRRTKLYPLLNATDRNVLERWFMKKAG